jgi:hypothetical protein
MFKTLAFSLLMAVAPASTNYTLNSYELGGGAGKGSSTTYSLQGSAGNVSGKLASTNYGLPAGVQAASTVSTPGAPTFVNDDSSYEHLHVTLNTSGFATDIKYLIAISSDDFATTNYVQLDNTVGASAAVANYQTYAAWGGASGFDVVGLGADTAYKVKVAALQGSATGSQFGPTASAATTAPSVTFSVQTSLASSPPFNVAFTSLTPGSVISGGATVTGTVTTNAISGGSFVITDQNSGLTSSSQGYTLASTTADLSVASSGYGARVSSTSTGSGGPLTSVSPFDGTGNNVGGISATRQAFASWSSPITSGSATLSLLAKSTTITPAATDYADVITISLSLLF